MINFIEKYKYGLIAVFSVYMFLFMYFNLTSHVTYYQLDSFEDGSYVEVPEDEISLKPENINTTNFTGGAVKNASRDVNSDGETSLSSQRNYSDIDAEQEYRDLEAQIFAETGGDKSRAAIIQEMNERKKLIEKANDGSENSSNNEENNFNTQGNVMVEWDLKNRPPHQNNDWFVRNPGYRCGENSNGRVVILIRVGRDGRVSNADYLADKSSGVNDCMRREAIEYAKKSRFKPDASAAKSQQGYIYYTFVSQ